MSSTHGIIKFRRGTAAEWVASQPQPGGEVLRLGEPGYEKDTGRLKIGDGTTPWNSLAYFNDGAPIDPEQLQDLLGGGLLTAGSGISINYNDLADTITISTSGVAFLNSPNFTGIPTVPTAPSGTNTTQIASTAFVRTEVSNLVDSAPALLDTLNELAAAINDDANFATTVASGLASKAPLVHTHVSSDITNFNSSVSGLIPVKDIVAGTGIGVSSTSGIYTINSSNTVASDTLEPDGFVNRTDSEISFNDGSRQFSIAPKAPATSYAIYNNGVKVVKSTTEITTLPDTTALYYIHFDKSTNNLSYKTTALNFDTDIPIAQIYYNADDNKAVYFGEERHGIRMDASTHRYLHNVFGTQYVNGLSISNYTISGDGSNNSDATIAIGDGLIYDEDIEANITHSNTPNDPFEQVLYPIAVIPVYYKVGSNGSWTDTVANNYPVKTDTTVQYNLNSAGTWSASNSDNPTNNRYIAYWICATTQENAPIISIMGQRIDSSLEQATSNNAWGSLNLNGLPIVELRPLYRLIYDTKSTFSNTPKGFLVDVLDIRSHIDTVTGLTQNDHGSLYGLADDDHYQYVHIDNARTIDAVHTFSNGLNTGGLISAASGNFSSLTVNSTGVSLVGHTHTSSNITDLTESVQDIVGASGFLVSGTGISINYNDGANILTIDTTGLQPSGNYSIVGHNHSSSDITDFNSAVSGLLPTVSNPSNGRLLTSDGTSTGIDAQQYLLYDDSLQQLKITYVNPGVLTPTGNDGTLRLQAYDSYNNDQIAGRLEFARYRGTIASPTGVITGDVLGVIRTIAKNSSNSDNTVNRIRFEADGETGGSNIYTPTRIRINSSSGPLQLDNTLILWSDGKLSHNGYMTIDDGLSAPTPVFGLGTISGDTAISYDVTKQIQTATLNGTAVNFTQGTGWDVANRSLDVMLVLTVTSTTTVSWTLVDDQYNAFPTFTAGTYLVLLRSIGTTIQGHYIGNKTN